jgi:hypothetical protein
MKLTTIALASAFTLTSTFALAQPLRHEARVRNYHNAYNGALPSRSVLLRPNNGNPNGNADGPTTLSGTGSSAFGGSTAGTSGYN